MDASCLVPLSYQPCCLQTTTETTESAEGHKVRNLTCCSFLLGGSGRDPSQGEGQNTETPEVLGGVLDDPRQAAVQLDHGGGAVLNQLELVPLAVRQHGVSHGALHLPPETRVRDVVDVAVPQLQGGNGDGGSTHS